MIKSFLGIDPIIDKTVFIAQNVNIIGDVEIGEKSSICYQSVLRGDVAKIKIGKNTNIQDMTVIHGTRANHIANKTGDLGGPINIGDNVTVGHSCILHACNVKNNSFIGMQSLLMDLSVVNENAMLAAGSLLPPEKIIPSGELWGGRPAKFMRKLTNEEIAFIQISADNYSLLAMQYI
jgi:carbonic anhydrase/acetyltransferase-like protein (isoleucine patch superfamily)